MARLVPTTLRVAIWLLWGLVAMSGLTALLTLLFKDEMELAWAGGNDAAAEKVRQGGLEALRESSINIPAFAPVAITAFCTFALMTLVLAAMLRSGHNWARLVVTAMVIFAGFLSVLTIGRTLPPLFTIMGWVSLVIYAALLFLLWHRDSTRYLTGDPIPAPGADEPSAR